MTIPYNISMTGIGEQKAEHFSKTWELKQYIYTVLVLVGRCCARHVRVLLEGEPEVQQANKAIIIIYHMSLQVESALL
jgi:hypothetical protein